MDWKKFLNKNQDHSTILLEDFSFLNLDIPFFFFLDKSLKQFNTLDNGFSLPSYQLSHGHMFQKWIIVTVNNTCRHHSDIYL